MMFVSDLDRTLIFSKNMLLEFPPHPEDEMIAVEYKEGNPTSFMTQKSYNLLQTISEKHPFIPVTTRSLEQFKRIDFSRLHMQYAITSNGANILYYGERLQDWNDIIQMKLSSAVVSIEEVFKKLDKYVHKLKGELRIVEELFFYFYLNTPVNRQFFKELQEEGKEIGWRISQQGRKLYFMPAPITKFEAIRYIQEREGCKILLGAGDSLFDHDFLSFCDYSYVPRHGELAASPVMKEHYTVTKNTGIGAGEEILTEISIIMGLSHSTPLVKSK